MNWQCAIFLFFGLTAIAFGQDGNFDSSFGDSGRVVVGVSTYEKYDDPVRLIVRPGNKLLMAGSCDYVDSTDALYNTFCLTQLNGDGTYDGNFGPGGVGFLEFDRFPTWPKDTVLVDMIVLRDGRISLLGYPADDHTQMLFGILLANGSGLDTSVGNGSGFFQLQFGGRDSNPESLIQQPDGKLLIAGGAAGANGNYDFAVLRLLADLSGPDTSFGIGGSQLIAFDVGGPSGGDIDGAYAVRLQSNGKIVLTGAAETSPAGQATELFEIAVTRLNSDGSRDLTFGTEGDGRVHYSVAGMDTAIVLDAQIDSVDRIVLGGVTENSTASTPVMQCVIDRLSADGSHDATFNQGNPLVYLQAPKHGDFYLGVKSIALGNNGIFAISSPARAAGGKTGTPTYFGVTRLNADGSFDARFGYQGEIYSSFTATADVSATGLGIAVGNGGLMVMGSQTQSGTNGNTVKFGIGRLKYDPVFADGFE